ncbi:acyl-CoA thioesterase [Burkholderia sp. Bp9143]|uniref:acyl-CoA thioesterase n=1 Tax=Burkholderia sp. Bp9143 TaxID=2184574 RepID=UPI000F5B087A|nr:acyl-CoA thioesterase [Burkholderia sp. Bp9143]RQR27775.1 acyl-CoA thioesterase [Burkholderia sp. Bp9143]
MIHSYEYVLHEEPFTVRRTVRWADCDPAGVVYTGRLSEYVFSAVALFKDFVSESSGGGHRPLGEIFDVGLPCRGMTFDFCGTLWPNDSVDIECSIGDIRSRSFDILLEGKSLDRQPIFLSKFSPICVRTDARIGTEIPDALRRILEGFARKTLQQTEST